MEYAIGWYLENVPQQVGRLAADLRETINRIRESPRLFRVVHRDIRRAALGRFPYLVWFVYFDEIDTAHVLAVSHHRQDPERISKLVGAP
jgi:plasmid stabilization system protein ParE